MSNYAVLYTLKSGSERVQIVGEETPYDAATWVAKHMTDVDTSRRIDVYPCSPAIRFKVKWRAEMIKA